MKSINMIVALITTVLATFVMQVNITAAQARVECIKQYGGGETCIEIEEKGKLQVEKKVWNPKSKSYENDIKASGGSNNYTFGANEKIEFRIIVKNTGDVELKDVRLEDILPNFVKYHSGDGEGKSDKTRVEFDKFDLKVGDSKEFKFTARVADDGILPKDDRICVTNIAKAKGTWATDKDETEENVDYANFCIDLPKVKAVIKEAPKEAPKVLPKTGADLLVIGSISLGMMLVGLGLRRVS